MVLQCFFLLGNGIFLFLAGTLYDLQGRKLESVHTPGIYIANGQKMLLLRQ